MQELQALGGVSQSVEDREKLVEDVKQFGRIPKQTNGTSEEERAENKLAKRFSHHRNSIPKDIMQELQNKHNKYAHIMCQFGIN